MLKRLEPPLRFVLGMATLIVLLAVTAGLWWWLPASPRATLASGRGSCQQITIAENGKTLVAIHCKELAVWDLVQRKELGAMLYRGSLQYLLAPDAETLAVAYQMLFDAHPLGSGWVWQPGTQPEPVPLPDLHSLVAFTADSRSLATSTGLTNRLWDVATARERRFPVPFKRIDGICPLPDGRIVVSNYHSEEGWLVDPLAITLWIFAPDLTLASKPITVPGVEGPVTISPDGQRFTAWQMNWGPRVTHLHDLENPLTADLAKLGDWKPHRVKFYDLNTGRELASFDSGFKEGQVPAPIFSPDGSRLLTDDRAVWDIATIPPRKLASLEGRDMNVSGFSPDGKWLVVRPYGGVGFAYDKSWQLLDATTLQKHDIQPPPQSEPRFASNGQTVAAKHLVMPSAFSEFVAKWVQRSGRPAPHEAVVVWNLPEGQQITELDMPSSFAYFPDGQSMAVGRDDGTIEIWDIPPRRSWYIDYGLPVLFALLVLLGMRMGWRAVHRPLVTVTT
jgi:WD40 repeat protein